MNKAVAAGASSAVTSRYRRWQETIDQAIKDPRWDGYDCDIRRTINAFNLHLRGDGYKALDWRLVKAVIWTESGGPANPAWKSNPMQIGNEGDPGLRALLFGNEGGDLVLPAAMRQRLTITSIASVPRFNIEAGTAYLLMRHARFSVRAVVDSRDTRIRSVLVEKGDSLDKIARRCGTTIENLKANNSLNAVLSPGQTLRYQKSTPRKVIVGWEPITPASIARRYNVGDPRYGQKLSYCLDVMRRSKSGDSPCVS